MSNEDHHKQEQQTIARYEASNGEDAGDGWLEGLPLVILTTRGRKSGEPRKVVLTRCLHEGVYAVVGSGPDPIGGTPTYSQWYLNLVADPHVTVRDRDVTFEAVARTGAQKKSRVVASSLRGVARLRAVPSEHHEGHSGRAAVSKFASAPRRRAC